MTWGDSRSLSGWYSQCFIQIAQLTHQVWGLGWLCPGRGGRWGSHCSRSTGTSSGPPCGCQRSAPDPSGQTGTSQKTICLLEHPLLSGGFLWEPEREKNIYICISQPHIVPACYWGWEERFNNKVNVTALTTLSRALTLINTLMLHCLCPHSYHTLESSNNTHINIQFWMLSK